MALAQAISEPLSLAGADVDLVELYSTAAGLMACPSSRQRTTKSMQSCRPWAAIQAS